MFLASRCQSFPHISFSCSRPCWIPVISSWKCHFLLPRDLKGLRKDGAWFGQWDLGPAQHFVSSGLRWICWCAKAKQRLHCGAVSPTPWERRDFSLSSVSMSAVIAEPLVAAGSGTSLGCDPQEDQRASSLTVLQVLCYVGWALWKYLHYGHFQLLSLWVKFGGTSEQHI